MNVKLQKVFLISRCYCHVKLISRINETDGNFGDGG